MKPETRVSGLFASATFLIVGVGGYFATHNPLHAMMYGVVASVVMAYIGYKIGYIVTHPKGGGRHKPSRFFGSFGVSGQGASQAPDNRTPLTGEETFLDDMGS